MRRKKCKLQLKNQYFLVRHGHSLRNVKKIASCWPEQKVLPLTEKGRKEVEEAAEKLKKKKIDLIFYSDLLRTKQTAEIIGQFLGIKPKPDKRLREINVGIFNGQPIDQIGRFYDQERKLPPPAYYQRRYEIAPPAGETYQQAEKRLLAFIQSMEKKYKNKKILIVSHQRPLTLLEKAIYVYDVNKLAQIITQKKEIKTGEIRRLC
ncbi:MAG: histidine phosphatase family protein [Minisyncoccales bacterium]